MAAAAAAVSSRVASYAAAPDRRSRSSTEAALDRPVRLIHKTQPPLCTSVAARCRIPALMVAASCCLRGGQRIAVKQRRRRVGRQDTRSARLQLAAAESQASSVTKPSDKEVAFLQKVLHEVDHIPLLNKTPEATIQELAEAMREVVVPAGDVIVQQGEKCNGMMYIIASGDVELSKRGSLAERFAEKTISGKDSEEKYCATRGEYFGARTLLGNTPQSSTAVAKSEARLWQLDRSVFDEIIIHAQKGAFEEAAAAEETFLEDDDEDSDDDEMELCSTADSRREIFIVSDSTGESASSSVTTALRQFEYCFNKECGTSRTTVYRFLKKPEEAVQIAELAATSNALVVHTIMKLELHEALIKACSEKNVDCCDLWGTLLEALEKKFSAKRSGITGRKQAVSEEYMRNVKAIEYTRKVDDGVSPNMWNECDLMIVGASRAGKTPLAFYLAQLGFKVANYPIVPDEEFPKELFEMDQTKIIGLLIQPQKLQEIRQQRMLQLNLKTSKYADIGEIKKEVNWIKTFYMRRGPKWPIIDTTDSGVVETASRILEILDRRKGDCLDAAYISPV